MELGFLLPFAIILLAWYFLLIRPQQQRKRQFEATQSAVKPGDEVLMGSGLYGRVVDLSEEDVFVEPSPGVRLRYARAAVMRIIEAPTALPDEDIP